MSEKQLSNAETTQKEFSVNSTTEDFSIKRKDVIEKKYKTLDEENKISLEDELKTIENKSTRNKKELDNIMKSIPLVIPIGSESLISLVNERILEDCNNNNINISNPVIYLYSILGPSKTLEEQLQYIEENKYRKKTILNNNEENELSKKVNSIDFEQINLDKRVNSTNSEIQSKQQEIEGLFDDYENAKLSINNSYNKLSIQEIQNTKKTITEKDLQQKEFKGGINTFDVLRDAFGYNFDIKDSFDENGKKIENFSDRENNYYIDQKILILVNYHARLRDKIQRSSVDPKIKISSQQIEQANNFSLFLKNGGINENEFFQGFNIDDHENINENNNKDKNGKGKKGIFDIKKVEDFKTPENNSSKSENNLGNLANSFDKIDSDNLKINPIFKDQFNKPKGGFDEKSLLKKFPMPKDKHILDFDINNPKLMGVIFSTLKNEKSHPLIEASTENKEKQVRAKKAMIVRLLFEANPNLKELPLKLASKLYPPKENKEQLIPTRRRKDRIEKELLIPLMYNNFCDANQEKLISEKIKEGYVKHFNNLMITTPGLNDFEIKPEEIILTNDKLKVPLYMKGQKNQTNNNLIVENGDIYITNSLYDPTNKVEGSLGKGKLYIGHMNDFKDFSENIINSIKPDVIKNSVTTKNPRIAYINQIDKIIQKPQDDRINQTQAQTAQGLSLIKVQNIAINDLLMKWHNNGEEKIDNNIVSNNNPFFNLINQYKDRKKIDVKENIHGSKILTDIINGALKGSANENEILATDLTKLTNKISDKTFNDKIEYYLKQPINNDLDKKKHSVLETLAAKNRTKGESLELFLKLFATHPEKANESINSINNISFHNFVEQLDNINDFDLLNINNINSNNPVFDELEKQYSPSVDDELANDLDDIDTTEKIETYIT